MARIMHAFLSRVQRVAQWFIPKSLWARLVLLLLAALLISHAASLAILSDDRRHAMRLAAGDAAVERIVAVEALIRRTPPQLHEQILEAASSRRLEFRVSHKPTAPKREPKARVMLMVRAGIANALGMPPAQVRVAYRGNAEAHSTHRFFDRDYWEDYDDDDDDDYFWSGGLLGRGRSLVPGMVASIPLGPRGPWLEAATRLNPIDPTVGVQAFASLLFSGIAVVIIVLLVTRRATRPLRDLATTAGAFGRGDLNAALPTGGSQEVRQVVDAFEEMRGRIDRFLRDRMQMLAAMSHDLRTPITTLRLRAELLDDEEARLKILETLDELQVMSEEVLSFIRADAAQEKTEKLELGALVQSLCDDASDLGNETAFSGLTAPLVVELRSVGVKRALRNLIDNAHRYGGGAVGVTLRQGDGNVCEILVEDQGDGVAPEQLETLFEPFVRGETSRSRETGGVGLGLAIARSIFRAHGGDLVLENIGDAKGANQKGPRGLRARASLPVHLPIK